ncbi:NRDE family protein [Sphaerisporangium aureirubrum]|uniref:NRDE family protein n=1 Tax=Sphaerisporangium aureirubrum TaxID=1544736 RepID=A0ABW1NUP0_9ACTN
MCTVIAGVDPGAETPVVLAGIRDEMADRPWRGPAAHWPGHPGLIGGLDLEAGGTWLAAEPAVPRVAALLNGVGRPAPPETRRSRGDLPLRAAGHGGLPETDLSVYDPFHLVLAEPGGVRLWHWDGEDVTEDKLPPGTHIVVNDGWVAPDAAPRAGWFVPRFAAAPRPSAHDPGDASWTAWRELLAGDGLPVTDPRALVVRRELDDGRVWGTSSVTLVALGRDTLRYDFCPCPGDPSAWSTVLR